MIYPPETGLWSRMLGFERPLKPMGRPRFGRERGRYALCIDDTWYSGFADECPANKGDTATVGYADVKKSGRTYYNIAYVKLACQGQPPTSNSMAERVSRSVALKAACAFLHGSTTDQGEVLELAGIFQEWLQPASKQSLQDEA